MQGWGRLWRDPGGCLFPLPPQPASPGQRVNIHYSLQPRALILASGRTRRARPHHGWTPHTPHPPLFWHVSSGGHLQGWTGTTRGWGVGGGEQVCWGDGSGWGASPLEWGVSIAHPERVSRVPWAGAHNYPKDKYFSTRSTQHLGTHHPAFPPPLALLGGLASWQLR